MQLSSNPVKSDLARLPRRVLVGGAARRGGAALERP